MHFWYIIKFTHLGLIPSILTTIREVAIPRCLACYFGKQSCTYPNENGSGSGIKCEYDQPGMCISIDQI